MKLCVKCGIPLSRRSILAKEVLCIYCRDKAPLKSAKAAPKIAQAPKLRRCDQEITVSRAEFFALQDVARPLFLYDSRKINRDQAIQEIENAYARLMKVYGDGE